MLSRIFNVSKLSSTRPVAQARKISSFLMTPSQVNALPSASTRILDATWFMPNTPRNAKEEFGRLRIPGAQFLDLDEVAAPSDIGLKHMMPSSAQFRDACDRFGISKDDSVILYDTHGILSSPRGLFMFKAFRHENAFVLNGGLPAWRDQGFPIEEKASADSLSARVAADPGGGAAGGSRGRYPIAEMDPAIIRSYEDMLGNAAQDRGLAELVLDARPNARFKGSAPEPRPGLPSGHMPNSISIPWNALLAGHKYKNGGSENATYTSLLERGELEKTFIKLFTEAETGEGGEHMLDRILRGEQAVVTSCGSGMTAAVIWLALHELGCERPVPLYDESWTGYASRKDSPILVDV